MKLYFLNEFLGDIRNINVDGMWVNAELNPSKNIDKFKDFFAAIVDEGNDFEENNFNEELLDDSNWYILDEENRRRGIYIPAVNPKREINWRWRRFIDRQHLL